jgi:hypothetical protein
LCIRAKSQRGTRRSLDRQYLDLQHLIDSGAFL